MVPTLEQEVEELLRHVDLKQATGVVEPFAGSGNIVRVLRKHGLQVVSNDLNPAHGARYCLDACQPRSWETLSMHLGVNGAVVTSPWFDVLDLALPVMMHKAAIVCMHVPYGYVPAGGIARQAFLAQLAREGRLMLIMGLERQGGLRNCAWLCVFASRQLRSRMVRCDGVVDVGWFRMASLPTTRSAASEEGTSKAAQM